VGDPGARDRTCGASRGASAALTVGAAAIVADDGWPIFFHQERVGHRRRPLRPVKLRTMRDGKNTRVGRWSRLTGVDEVPQFWNVFRGEMSVVGPRPLTAAHVARLGWDEPAHDWRFSVKPGVTGPVRVLGAVSAADSERVEGAYLAGRCLGLDSLIVAASSAVLVFGRDRVLAKTRAAFERVMAGEAKTPVAPVGAF
jgi:lipopolysaccharide/colanic/teichoic acid biosynthesis glycosyltransferase